MAKQEEMATAMPEAQETNEMHLATMMTLKS